MKITVFFMQNTHIINEELHGFTLKTMLLLVLICLVCNQKNLEVTLKFVNYK